MRVLLDSHVFLWALNNPELIGPKSLEILDDAGTRLLVSAISIWELGLKHNLHKQPYTISEMLDGIRELKAELLKLEEHHLVKFESIALKHKDPFDSLLVAQSEAEYSIFMTADKNILASPKYLIANASK